MIPSSRHKHFNKACYYAFMDNSSTPGPTPVQPPAGQETTPPAPVQPGSQQPIKSTPSKTRVILVAAGFLLVIALIPLAYTLGRMQSIDDMAQNISTDTSSTSDTKLAEEIEEAPVEITDKYDGWNTYGNEVYGYSFKYPSNWVVERDVMQERSDWVSINPADDPSSDRGDVLAIYTYFDGTGCPQTKTKEFSVGGYTAIGTACVEDNIYRVGMRHSKVVSTSNSGVVLARTAPDLVGIQIDMGRGQDEVLQQILDSITGLTPYQQ